jgi:hypothetical protein
MRNISKIISRMRSALNVATDKELCEVIGESQSTISSWKARGKVPYEHIDALSLKTGKPFEWFLDGSTQCATCELTQPNQPDDPYISSVSEMMRAMDDDTKKDIQLSVQKEKLLRELIKERQEKEAA